MNLRGPALLDALRYLPALRSRQAELKGYEQLRDETKAVLHPLVSLGKLGRQASCNQVAERIREKVGGCFLDVNPHAYQTCDDWERLFDEARAFEAWRQFAAEYENVIPTALLRDGVGDRAFVRQVIEIERQWGTVVIRSRRPSAELAQLQAALTAVDDVNNVLIVLDYGYVRQALEPKIADARRVITALRMTDPYTRVVVMGSSFPRSVVAYGEGSGSLEILERDLHAQIGGDEVAIYGDHCSIYPEPFEPSISRFVPRVDYCTEVSWVYRRKRDDDGGYVAAARLITESEDWDPQFAEVSWGAGVIADTVQNGATLQGFGAPANWIAARVNMHIERQVAVSAGGEPMGDDINDEYDL